MCALTPDNFRDFKVLGIRKANKAGNVVAIDVSLGSAQYISGIETSGFVVIQDHLGNKRPYTPVSANDKRGEMTFLIKYYPTGVVSKNLIENGGSSTEGTLSIKGPLKKKAYEVHILHYWYQ